MSRSGYSDDMCGSQEENWQWICWRGAVKSALKGSRGQAFLKELLAAMDAMPEKKLIANELEDDGQFCTLGVIGNARGIDMSKIHVDDPEQVSSSFDIAKAMAQEIVYINDEYPYYPETPEKRWSRMREWVSGQINN